MEVKRDNTGKPLVKDVINNTEIDGYADRKDTFCYKDKNRRCGQTSKCELYLDSLDICAIRAYCISNIDKIKVQNLIGQI